VGNHSIAAVMKITTDQQKHQGRAVVPLARSVHRLRITLLLGQCCCWMVRVFPPPDYTILKFDHLQAFALDEPQHHLLSQLIAIDFLLD